MKWFVWIAGLRGPEAQLWDEAEKTVDGKKIKTLMKVKVPDDMGLAHAQATHPLIINEAKT